MDLSPAPFFAEIAKGPEGGTAQWVQTNDGLRIRVGHWPAAGGAAPKGTVLIFPGRTEHIEKYGPTATDFCARGFAVLAVDWRGQGIADRMLEDRRLGHVGHFSDFQRDVAAIVAYAEAEELPQPWFLLGHSMGGAIGLRAILDGLPVKACAFTGPMWGIHIPTLMKPLEKFLTAFGGVLGMKNKVVPTLTTEPYACSAPFEGNSLTTDEEMFAFIGSQIEAEPDLALGGPTINWLIEAISECRALNAAPSPDLPCLTFVGAHEQIVHVPSIRNRMRRWPRGKLVEVPNAEHEVLLEKPEIRDTVHAQIAEHFTAAV